MHSGNRVLFIFHELRKFNGLAILLLKSSVHIRTLTQSSGRIFSFLCIYPMAHVRARVRVRVYSQVSDVKFRLQEGLPMRYALTLPLSLHYYATDGLCRT